MTATEVIDKELILKALRTVSAMEYALTPKKLEKKSEISTKIISVEQASFKISMEPFAEDPAGFAKFVSTVERDELIRFVCDIPALNAAIEFQTTILKKDNKTCTLELPKVVQQHARRAAKRLTLNALTEFMAVEGRFVRRGVDLEYRSKDFTFQFVIDNVSVTGAALVVPKNVSVNTLENFNEIELTFKLIPGYNVKKLAKIVDFRSSKTIGANEFKVLRVHYKEPAAGNFLKWIHFVESLEAET